MVDTSTKIDPESKNKVALKLLGGGVPNVAFQFGVVETLKNWGFSINTGCLNEGEERQYGPRTLNPIIGSSSGAFATLCLAMGYNLDDLMGKTDRIPPITEDIVKDPLETGIFALLKRLYTSRRKYTRLKQKVMSDPSVYEHIINTYYPIWSMDSMKDYLCDTILSGCTFETLRSKLYILAVTLEQRMTLILGEESRDRNPEEDFKFQSGIPPWTAAAGSMSLPPYYEPLTIPNPPEEIQPDENESVVLIDGEIRDPYHTDVAEQSGADLIFVSSFYRVHEYNETLGHISDYGTVPVMFQERAQARDASKHNSIQSRRRRKEALKLYREQLQETCSTQEEIENMMAKMEETLGFRENVDVVEIQAQDYASDELIYPYWDPFTINEDSLNHLYQAGREVAHQSLENHVKSI